MLYASTYILSIELDLDDTCVALWLCSLVLGTFFTVRAAELQGLPMWTEIAILILFFLSNVFLYLAIEEVKNKDEHNKNSKQIEKGVEK